jgi:hypothetical protein
MPNIADPPIVTLVVNWLKATGRNQGRDAALIEAQKMLFAVTAVLMREQGPEWARKVLARAALATSIVSAERRMAVTRSPPLKDGQTADASQLRGCPP